MTKVLTFNKSSITVFPDKLNFRLRVDDYFGNQLEILALINRSIESWGEKVIIKSRKDELDFFLVNGFVQEAKVPGYFTGVDMYLLVKYPHVSRGLSTKLDQEEIIITNVLRESPNTEPVNTTEVEIASGEDADELTKLYSSVFKVYATPINMPGYISKTIKEGMVYAIIRENEKIVSSASAEINVQYRNAELTDCASLPEAQGKGHMKKLLTKLEGMLFQRNIKCLYTIARAESYGMNKVFHQLGYSYSGRMINNCNIYSGLEDMNVWYKLLPHAPLD